MVTSAIKNVIFDIGNVFVRWSPQEVLRLTFGDESPRQRLGHALFHHDLWKAFNRGEYTETQMKIQLIRQFEFLEVEVERFFYYVKETQIMLHGQPELFERVRRAGYFTYALTDNVMEVIDHLKVRYPFWHQFDGTIVSAQEGCLKPDAAIFERLLQRYTLIPSESVFIDDMPANVEGARQLGFAAIQYSHSCQCEQALKALGLDF